jgi:flagellar biosynthesis anti-sigma factor FlgM
MKISDLFGRVSSSPQRSRLRPEPEGRAEQPTDRSSISPRAKLLAKLAEGDTRNARVEQLKESIDSGSYQVPTDKVAVKIARYFDGE